ncbi:MAG: beta-ketoacyl synthase N-terminal-like domain-containing protein, partial [Ilumatobacteraceae bacterium]
NGAMAAVFAPLDEVQRVVDEADGYVVLANVNSTAQAVIGGATAAVHAAVETCKAKGFTTALLPVSHAFHTSIVAPASAPLRVALERLQLHPPALPIVSNVTGEFYPMGAGVTDEMLDLLARQVASPVQFVAGLQTLYQAGARVFVEVGPKRALHGFALDVLGHDQSVVTLSTNHPKLADEVAFNQALCGLYAAGLGAGVADAAAPPMPAAPVAEALPVPTAPAPTAVSTAQGSDRMYTELGRLFADFLDKSRHLFDGNGQAASSEPVVVTGAALGLPGTEHVFDDENVARILRGEQFIDVIPTRIRAEMLDKHITRLVKGDGGGRFETIEAASEVIKLAGRGGVFDLGEEFGVEAERLPALGKTTRLAIGAGIDALRDAGIPLVMRYKTSSIGTQLPDGWGLPDALRDDTGVIFASAFPGLEEMTDEVTRHAEDTARRAELAELSAIRERVADADATSPALAEIDRRLHDVQRALDQHPYTFDRRFLFRVLSMGHSQFAEMIGARGPNTQINAACASTTQAIALAEDWIRAGRCRRVVVVAADDATSDHLLGWIGAGFLASGAAATDEDVAQAALPFDRRRHGMLLGMGAAALVVESAPAARERGLQPICEVIGAVTANSAFHGTRLNVDHIGDVMETVVGQAERRGIDRHRIAAELVFVSHETYTPARGGSAAAEIYALRRVFGPDADKVVIANTKGFTGHPMGVGIEDVVAVKALETGIVPPVPNFREVDPELGNLNLSTGGAYPVRYALRLAAGFGSQIAMVMLAWTPVPDGRHRAPDEVGFGYRVVDPQAWQRWLTEISGHEHAALEVVQRRLRVVDAGPGARPA